MPSNTYSPGHDPSIISSHLSRSAAKEASHILPHITISSQILDVGCGPGSISCDFAALASSGAVIGIDQAESVIDAAQAEASKRNMSNVTFQVANVCNLPFDNDTFDIVHCNAVIVHLPNPVDALKEMRRVCKPSGRVCARESDWDTYVIHPLSPALKRCGETMRKWKADQGAEPNAGRYLAQWAIETGFPVKGVSVECDTTAYFGKEETGWLGEQYARRMETEVVRNVTGGAVTEEQLQEWIEAWREWGRTEGAIWVVMHMRMIAVK